jgi:hypothetical protein
LHLIIISIVLILFSVETASSQCLTTGDQISYGAGNWIGYVYSDLNTSNPPSNVFTSTYRGYVTQTETFDQNLGSGAISGGRLCNSYSNQFSIRYKMQKNFTPGYYIFIVGGDDGYRLSIDGGGTFLINNFTDHSYTTSTSSPVYLSGSMDLVLEYYEQGGESRISFSYSDCINYSTAPTSISGTTIICSGSNTTLTANGGTEINGSIYQWGTGIIPGTNIISGQTSASITISPTTNTTYWVRRIDPAPCNTITSTITQTVTVTPSSTEPTSITGSTSVCLGNSSSLTATGGTLGSGLAYQWGTGTTVGSNIIADQTGVSIVVTPTSTTSYWVRRTNATPCSAHTNAATMTVTVNIPTGDQTRYGNNSWIGYVYSGLNTTNPPSNAFSATYRGYITESETFDHNYGAGSLSGPNICGNYPNQFSIRHKMEKNFASGYYTFTVGGDDGYRLSIDGGETFLINNFTDHGYTTSTSAQVYLSGNTYLVLEYYEQGGDSRVNFSYSSCTNYSTAPTGISGPTSFCLSTGGTTLEAIGGYEAPNATYQWGVGSTIGANIISGANSPTYYINPSTAGTYTYWVRRYDPSPCGLYTSGITQTVTVSAASTNPTSISATANTICSGTSINLTAVGGSLVSGGSYQWGTGWTVGSNIISGQTSVVMTVAPTVSTVYWVRRIDPAPCNTQTPGVTRSISVVTPSVAPTGISGTTSICYGTGGTTLTAIGGTLGTNATYQWGTGSSIGSGIIAGANTSTYYINPSTTTTYWVRIVDASPCSSSTAGITLTINVSTSSTAPTGISGTTSICNGNSTVLTATGGTASSGATYQWGIGWAVGSNIISGQTSVSITVNPSATTVYWVRRIDPAPCNTQTGGPTKTITVTNPSTAPTSITGAGPAACAGNSTTLTAAGGTAATGSTYQWGTGSVVGFNVLSGQTGISITVNPNTTTTYWVRRYDTTPCSSYTSGTTTTVSILAPPGNPTIFGTNVWNVYGYSVADITLATAVYAGYYSVNTLNFDTQSGTNNWSSLLSPSSSAGWTGCAVPNDNFTFVSKRKGFPCGTYTLALQNWDDETKVYLNGVQIWSCTTWSGGGACSGAIGSYILDSDSEIEIRVREITGNANVGMTFTNTNIVSTAPTSISGTTTICNGTSTTLTATGGTTGTTGSFEWGIGSTVGLNTISGQTTASITVSPSTTTTYWVRRVDCSNTTSGVTQSISVTTGTIAGTLSTTSTTICRNTKPNAINLSGNIGNVLKWQYANDVAFTSDVTDIANTTTTLSSIAMGNLATTRYYRALVQHESCTIQYTTPIGITISPTLTYTNGSWNGIPDETSSVIISSNLTLNSNLNVCSCQVTAGVTVTVNSGNNLIIQTSLTVDNTANIIVHDKASLVQIDDSSVDIGNITVYRKSAPMKLYDFTYWSSPVQNWRLNQLSPNTLSDKYFSFDPLTNNWVTLNNGTAIMEPSKGYIVRAPQGGWSTSNATGGVYEGSFIGVPNTGVIPITIEKGVGYMNLIGNPYPSAIDIDLFLTDPINSGIVNGTVYLWTHNTAISSTLPGNNIYNYTSDDYAKYNLTGGIKTASSAITGGMAPDGKIASGQGFFIEANTSLAEGTYTANFKNSMRLVGSNDQFYRINSNNARNATNTSNSVEKNRLWINMSNSQGAYNETLLGYVTGATNGYDNLFDGKTLPAGNVLSLYTISDTHTFAIQGRALPFVNTDVIPLGYNTTIAGDFTISIENTDGFFQNQNVYLIDKLNNTTQNLKNGSYSFTTVVGSFDDRFELRFINNALGTNQNNFNEDSVIIYTKERKINVHATVDIEEITVYDMLGRKLFTENNINATDFKTNHFNTSTEALVVKVKLSNQIIVTKKVMIE